MILGLITFIFWGTSLSVRFSKVFSSLYWPMIAPPEPVNLAEAPAERASSTISIFLELRFITSRLISKFLLISSSSFLEFPEFKMGICGKGGGMITSTSEMQERAEKLKIYPQQTITVRWKIGILESIQNWKKN